MEGEEVLSVLFLPSGEKKDKKDCCPLRMNYSSSSHTDDLLKATDVLRSPASQSLL